MNTLILMSNPRVRSTGNTWTLEVLGESQAKDAVKASIDALDHHPAKAARRSLIDALGIIEKHNFRIVYTEHFFEEELEGWLFILQG